MLVGVFLHEVLAVAALFRLVYLVLGLVFAECRAQSRWFGWARSTGRLFAVVVVKEVSTWRRGRRTDLRVGGNACF